MIEEQSQRRCLEVLQSTQRTTGTSETSEAGSLHELSGSELLRFIDQIIRSIYLGGGEVR